MLALSNLAQAQATTSAQLDADEQRRATERQNQLREQQDHTPDVRLSAPSSELSGTLSEPQSPCFTIHALELQGSEAGRFGWLLGELNGLSGLDSPLNKCLGTKGIGLVLHRAQEALVTRGYVTSRVLAQPQDLSSGKLVLSILPGHLREVRFAQPVDPRATAWNATPFKPGDILNLRDIEQALENFTRVPTADADIQIVPAEGDNAQPGQSDLLISYKQGMPFRLSLSADDSGTPSTGKYQGSATISYDNWWTLNDLFYISLNQDLGGGDAGPRGTHGDVLHYSLPFGYWMLGTTVSHNQYHQNVAGATQDYSYSGVSKNREVKLSRLIHRNTSHKTTLSLRAFQRASNNYIDDTEVLVQRRIVGGWELSGNHRAYMGAATLDANLAYRRGTGAFGSIPSPEEAFGEGSSRFKLITADANLSVPFKLGEQALQYSGTWRFQRNHSPLTRKTALPLAGVTPCVVLTES